MRLNLLILFLTCFWISEAAYSQSVLSAGAWYKFAIEKEGVYKLTYSDLKNLGIAVNEIDPQNIRVYGNPGGMLPHLNGTERPFDLLENAISIEGQADGNFDAQDFILFYAQGPDEYFFDEEAGIFSYKNNKYANKNFYFLTISNEQGKRIESLADLGASNTLINSYTKLDHFEKDELNLLHSGREWFGRLNSDHTLKIPLPYTQLAPMGDMKIFAELMAQSTGVSSFELHLNDFSLGEVTMETINNYTNQIYRYSERGKVSSAVFEVQNEDINTSAKELSLNVSFKKASTSISRGYYNQFLVQAELPLEYHSKELIFQSIKSLQHGVVTYKINNATEGLQLWNVTKADAVGSQSFALNNKEITFGAISSTLEKYVLFDPAKAPSPEFITAIENQNLKGLSTPDLLIISHPDFNTEAKRLAEFRRQHNGYSVVLATTGQIYNEFSSGRMDIVAIRDFIKYLYDKSPGKLKYVMLVGKGSYDYMDYSPNNTNFVPIYQSENSLHPLRTYSSDDFYGFLEAHEGEWKQDHTLEVAIGRLPVTTAVELKNIVNKFIHYSTSPETLGEWKTKFLFVADDGDNNLYNSQAEDLSEYVDSALPDYSVKKLYLDSYKQVTTSTEQSSPDARKDLARTIEKGVFLVNFIGHGGEKQWMDEEILDYELIESLQNYNKLPLFVTATCDFGRHDDPMIKSGGERLVLHPTGGGIGLVTTARPVYSSSNFILNQALYEAYQELDEGVFTLGDLIKKTKNNSSIGTNNRNFSLLGDPSLQFNLSSSLQAAVENFDDLDTLKSLQEVEIFGYIKNQQGNKISGFNGKANITLTDKPVQKRTRGDEYEGDSPFVYSERSSIIFKGDVSVIDGEFKAIFKVPSDIDHKLGSGELSIYAFDRNNNQEAKNNYKVLIGGSSSGVEKDLKAPEIAIYLEDTTFQNGDVVGSDALLLVYLKDENGINITGRSFNSNIIASFEGEEFTLNEYFKGSLDDHSSGWVAYPLEDIKPGNYTLTVSGSDVYNNTSVESVNFTVTGHELFEIKKLFNVPNPALEYTKFIFMHNRAGEALEGELVIYDSQGREIKKVNFETEVGQVRHEILTWDCRKTNGIKLEPGIYYYHVNARSKLDGAWGGKFQKLIILN